MAELRQWCPTCQAVTVTWVDTWAVSHCSGCDPDTSQYDWKRDDDDGEEL